MARDAPTRLVLENPRRMRGLLAATLAAWAFFMVAATVIPLLASAVWSFATGQSLLWPSFEEIFGYFGLAAKIGLPIALIVCFAVGYPAWKFASSRGLTTRRDAIKIGAIAGGALYLLLSMSAHIMVYMSSGSNFSYAQGGVILTKDNLPTFQGILFDLFLTCFYAANGAVAGLAAWLAGGLKSVVSADPQLRRDESPDR